MEQCHVSTVCYSNIITYLYNNFLYEKMALIFINYFLNTLQTYNINP